MGLCLILQVVRGLLLSFHFIAGAERAFSRVVAICDELRGGWFLRALHANGASFFFICLYLHIGRGLYYNSFRAHYTWIVGVRIFLAVMATAFTGYVLPWGQMSYWGAAVITGLFSAIPYVGEVIVEWLWGGFSVGEPTLNRFFGFHFVLPFVVIALVLVHIFFLHERGSRRPLGLVKGAIKVRFRPVFVWKDRVGFILLLGAIIGLVLFSPDLLGDVENFNEANSIITPRHIQPEWYYLFAYAILRCVPNKLGGVLALLRAVIILYFLPFRRQANYQKPELKLKLIFWFFVRVFIILTWLGACTVEPPYINLRRVFSGFYFMYFLFVLIKGKKG